MALIQRREASGQPPWFMAAKQGETWALEQFYYSYRPMVYTLCYRLLSNLDDAEDATQTTFMCAIRGLKRFRGDSSIRTWIYRIAVNEATALLRCRRKRPLQLDPENEPANIAAGTFPGNTENLVIQSALARVSADHRAILVLRFWEEMSYEDISQALRISLSATRMRIRRAKLEFRKYYQEEM